MNLMVTIKDYMTIEVWTLIVAIATFIVSCLAYRHNRRSDKRRIKSELARKRAILRGMENHMKWGQVEFSAAAHLRGEMAGIEAEIMELESQLYYGIVERI